MPRPATVQPRAARQVSVLVLLLVSLSLSLSLSRPGLVSPPVLVSVSERHAGGAPLRARPELSCGSSWLALVDSSHEVTF